jgi:leader peptidase (prepilin peptidase)/N-methyltransferase
LHDPALAGAGALFGLIVGSFLATVAKRWPIGRSALAGRSQCDHCGSAVAFYDLVPLTSFLLLRGKSRCCESAIDPVHPLSELAAAIIGGVAFWQNGLPGIWNAAFGWMLILLACLDWRYFWLPDRLTGPLGLLGLLSALQFPFPSFGDRLIGIAAGFVSLELIRVSYKAAQRRDGLGAGDAKLLGAIGAWLGWASLPSVLLTGSAIGLFTALGIRLLGKPVASNMRLPLGTFLAIAAWIVSLCGPPYP